MHKSKLKLKDFKKGTLIWFFIIIIYSIAQIIFYLLSTYEKLFEFIYLILNLLFVYLFDPIFGKYGSYLVFPIYLWFLMNFIYFYKKRKNITFNIIFFILTLFLIFLVFCLLYYFFVYHP